jgi:hypothetical protein
MTAFGFLGNDCERFAHLSEEARDRDLSPAEARFLSNHATACESCQRMDSTLHYSLNLLRNASEEPESDFQTVRKFDQRLLRAYRVQQTSESVRYWAPAIFGAIAAALVFLALIAIVQIEPTTPPATLGESSASRTVVPNATYPDLELPNTPVRVR